MKLPLQVTFRHMAHSDAVDTDIRDRAMKLDHLFPRINSCRVVIEISQHRQAANALFRVRLDVTVPHEELAATHEDEDAHVAVHEAFEAMRREIHDYVAKHRHP